MMNDDDMADDALLTLRVWLALFSTVKQIEGVVRKNLRTEFSSTLPRFDLLSQLYRSSDGLTMGELSNRLMVTNGNVTGLISRRSPKASSSGSSTPRTDASKGSA